MCVMAIINNPEAESCTYKPRGEGLTYKKGLGCSSYLLGVKKVILVPLRVFSLKKSSAGAFVVPFRVLSWKKLTCDNVLFWNWYLLGVKKISSHTFKTGSWHLLGVLFKITDKHTLSFYEGRTGVVSGTVHEPQKKRITNHGY